MAKDKIAISKIAVIGGSAGSLEVVLAMLHDLKLQSNAAVVVVLHRKNEKDSLLEDLIGYRADSPVREIEDKDALIGGNVYIAPPDYHLLFESEHLFALDSSEKINYSRPSIDVSFESAAAIFGKNVMGILLSGANADGAAGLAAIKKAGGLTIAQDPESADVPFMPKEAIKAGGVIKIIKTEFLSKELSNFLTE